MTRQAGPSPLHLPATGLLTPDRLDLVVKWLFVRGLQGQADEADTRALYRWHIEARTDASGDRGKRSTDTYEASARALFASVSAQGLDPSRPLPLSRDGTPLDGAHRIAIALALGLDVPVIRTAHAATPAWGWDWFVARGCPEPWRTLIARTFATLQPEARLVVWWNDEGLASWPEGWRGAGTATRVVPRTHVAELVRDVYAVVLGPRAHPAIEDKAARLGRSVRRLRVDVCAPRTLTSPGPVPAPLAPWKHSVRGRLPARGGLQASDRLHTTDTASETRAVAEMLLSENYRRQLLRRSPRAPRPQLLEWLARSVEVLAQHGCDREDACVVGSAALEPFDVRPATDIDCILHSRARAGRFGDDVTALGDGVDLVRAAYHRASAHRQRLSDDRIVDDPEWHFRFRGVKIANPELVLDRKAEHGRPKDLRDLALARWLIEDGRPARQPALSGRPEPVALIWDARGGVEARRFWEDVDWYSRRAGIGLVVTDSQARQWPTLRHVPLPYMEHVDDDLPGFARETVGAAGLDADQLLSMLTASHGVSRDADEERMRLQSLATRVRWQAVLFTVLDPALIVAAHAEPADELALATLSAQRQVPMLSLADGARPGIRHLRRVRLRPATRGMSRGRHMLAFSRAGTFVTDAALERRRTPDSQRFADLLAREIHRAPRPRRVRLQSPDSWARWLRMLATARELRADYRAAQAERNRLETLGWLVRAASISHQRPIWIWGAGQASEGVREFMRTMRVPVAGLISGMPVAVSRRTSPRIDPPERLRGLLQAGVRPFVLIASQYLDQIEPQLSAMGLGAGDDYMWINPAHLGSLAALLVQP
jgi:hypothetical protein